MRTLWTLTANDLRQRLRDKSVLIFGLVVPLALISVLNLVFGDTDQVELSRTTVAVDAPSGEVVGDALLATYDQLEGIPLTVERAENAEARVRDGDAQLAVTVPDGFDEALVGGEDTTVEVVQGDDTGLEVSVVVSVTRTVLDQYRAGVVASAAAGRVGMAPDEVATVAEQVAATASEMTLTEGRTSDQQLDTGAALVAGQAGLFLLFTVGFGVLGLLTERKQGTLARIRSAPVRAGTVVLSKALVSLVLGVVATGLLLTVGAVLFGAEFGSPVLVGLLIVCVVTAGTSLMFIIARVARTEEQANVAQSILAIGLGVAGGSFFPIAASGLLGTVLDLNPIAAFTRGLGITGGGGGLGDLAGPIAIMLGFAVVCLGLSRLIPDRTEAL